MLMTIGRGRSRTQERSGRCDAQASAEPNVPFPSRDCGAEEEEERGCHSIRQDRGDDDQSRDQYRSVFHQPLQRGSGLVVVDEPRQSNGESV